VKSLSVREQPVVDADLLSGWLFLDDTQKVLTLVSALTNQSFVTISRVFEFLSVINEEDFRQMLDRLFEIIKVRQPSQRPSFNVALASEREILAMALRYYPTAPGLRDIVVRFTQSKDATLAAAAYARLPQIKDSEVVDLLVSGLSHESGEVRALAVEGLGIVRVDALLRHLDPLIVDEDRLVRQSVAALLDKVDPQVQQRIVRRLQFDSDHEVRLIVSDFLEGR
jgi:hypothetical protein